MSYMPPQPKIPPLVAAPKPAPIVAAPVIKATPFYPTPTGQPIAPKVSTTTISNANKIAQVPAIVKKTDTLSQKGVVTDPATGIATLPNGKVATQPEERDANGLMVNPPDAIYDVNTGKKLKQPKTKTKDLGVDELPEIDTSFEDKAIMRNLDEMQRQNDEVTSGLIANIKEKFAIRKSEHALVNARQAKTVNNALLMGGVTGQGGSAQYAPISSEGIVNAQENYGIQQLAKLDAEENDLIAAARAAQLTGNYKILQAKNDEIESKRAEKVKVATKLNEDIAKRNNKAREATIQSSRDLAVADLYAQGITEVPKLLDYLNKDEQGNTIGDFTAEEVAKTLKNVANKNGLDDVEGLNALTKSFYMLKNQPGGLPDFILALPDVASQLAAFVKMYNTAEKGDKAAVTTGVVKSGKAQFTVQQISNFSSTLEKSKGPDGYVDPDAYQAAYEAWTDPEVGGIGKDFLLKFPPKQYVNPANQTLPAYLRSSTAKTTGRTV